MKQRDTLRALFGPFVVIPVALLERCRDSSAVHLYAILARYANHERRAWPGQDRLAREMGCSVRSMQRALGVLRDADFVRWAPRRERGAIVGTEYLLVAQTDGNLGKTYTTPVSCSSEESAETPVNSHTTPVSPGADHTTPVSCRPPELVDLPDGDHQTTRQKLHDTGVALTRSSTELDPKNGEIARARNDADRLSPAADVIAYFSERWSAKYGVPCSLVNTATDYAKLGQHLGAGLTVQQLKAGIVAYLDRADDLLVRRRRHPMGLWLGNPMQYVPAEIADRGGYRSLGAGSGTRFECPHQPRCAPGTTPEQCAMRTEIAERRSAATS